MPEVFASLGSNQEREKNIHSAVDALRDVYGSLRLSPVYQNKAVGFVGDDFLNMVVSFPSDQPPEQIQQIFRDIETAHGRQRDGERFAPRSLDIDLILYGEQVSEQHRLPRADILLHAFVLKPLTDLVPDKQHPVLKENYAALWEKFEGDRALTAIEGVFAE